jgi:hypothetical protein
MELGSAQVSVALKGRQSCIQRVQENTEEYRVSGAVVGSGAIGRCADKVGDIWEGL